jgi:catechol 2,3-dioxygenase-like lactoylglutathione lyase family enzyme
VKFNHISLVVTDPDLSAEFYARYLVRGGKSEWLGNSLHLRSTDGVDLAFQKGTPATCVGAHHGFLAVSSLQVDELLVELRQGGVEVTDDCTARGLRSIKFLDVDGYEVEVYWEESWP